ncbi:polyphosphate kinase [Novimethylophilus kurashikiensis]|uniref:Polyphosphate kinase n=1 Tax=Novimethylophilus kurashikiensis TaxID=1825523 RepID=A0A2R5F2A1_9PROT|nr:polyphosphate:AMP phosphotransferase [Novimethylophilus kurashikiensis]GBG12575.1 polyphosphate kinase [Novimethylophilus kurashikiensis]
MFESAELGHKIDKETYQKEIPTLREALLEAQYDLAESKKFPVIILISGVDGSGKGETANLLNAWMDPRTIRTSAFGAPSEEEAERPHMWRYWQALPPKGRIGIHFGSWYTDPIIKRAYGEIKNEGLTKALDEIVRFEKMLTDEGALVLKFWFHLSKEKQKERFKKLEADSKTRWRVSDIDKKHLKMYDEFREISEHTLRETSTAAAPWIIVEGTDANYRNLTVAKQILEAIRNRLDHPEAKPQAVTAPPLIQPVDKVHLLSKLDLSKKLDKKDYEEKLEEYQGKLSLLTRDPRFKKLSAICVFEGADAAGKGGSIRRITQAIDARIYRITPIAAPTEEERAQPYLWRFWRHVPRHGRLAVFDRSWYGRVLVERVEGFCSEYDWMRAYSEINDFEEQLSRKHFLVIKFWLQISKDEQLKRFEERKEVAFKRFKITEEDWRNREKWDQYQAAVCDMIDRTSTDYAPWTIVEANDKNYARIKILKTLCERIEKGLEQIKPEK